MTGVYTLRGYTWCAGIVFLIILAWAKRRQGLLPIGCRGIGRWSRIPDCSRSCRCSNDRRRRRKRAGTRVTLNQVIYPPMLLALVFVECGMAEGMPSIKKVVRVRERLNRSASLEGRVCHLSSRVEGIDIHSRRLVDRVIQ